jgi:signal transduction histidine kinase
MSEAGSLARELHDSVTQALFAATMKSEALTLDDALPPRSADTVEEVRRLTRGALAQMRTLLLELRADPLEEIPIQQLLRLLVEATESRVTDGGSTPTASTRATSACGRCASARGKPAPGSASRRAPAVARR